MSSCAHAHDAAPVQYNTTCWGWWGFFSKQRQILTRQISVHTGKFLEDFRKHGRGMGRGQGGPSSQPLPA